MAVVGRIAVVGSCQQRRVQHRGRVRKRGRISGVHHAVHAGRARGHFHVMELRRLRSMGTTVRGAMRVKEGTVRREHLGLVEGGVRYRHGCRQRHRQHRRGWRMERSSGRGALGRGARLHTRWLAVELLLVVVFAIIVVVVIVVAVVIVAVVDTVQAAVAACSVATLIAIVLV